MTCEINCFKLNPECPGKLKNKSNFFIMAAPLVPFSPVPAVMDIYQYSSYKLLNYTLTLQLFARLPISCRILKKNNLIMGLIERMQQLLTYSKIQEIKINKKSLLKWTK